MKKETKTAKPEGAAFDLMIDSVKWREIRGLKQRLARACGMTIAFLPKTLQEKAFVAEWTVLLTTDAAVRRLNHDFRGLDKPTNVLSFPAEEPAFLRRRSAAPAPFQLGDIAIAYQYVAKESKEQNKILLDHVTHLVIHGLLHLFGYDHMTDADAAKMEKMETKIMAALGLADPYAPEIEETPAPRKARVAAKMKKRAA